MCESLDHHGVHGATWGEICRFKGIGTWSLLTYETITETIFANWQTKDLKATWNQDQGPGADLADLSR